MKPSRDLLKIRRAMSKVPQSPTVADELAEIMEEAIDDINETWEVSLKTENKMRAALARYRASKTK